MSLLSFYTNNLIHTFYVMLFMGFIFCSVNLFADDEIKSVMPDLQSKEQNYNANETQQRLKSVYPLIDRTCGTVCQAVQSEQSQNGYVHQRVTTDKELLDYTYSELLLEVPEEDRKLVVYMSDILYDDVPYFIPYKFEMEKSAVWPLLPSAINYLDVNQIECIRSKFNKTLYIKSILIQLIEFIEYNDAAFVAKNIKMLKEIRDILKVGKQIELKMYQNSRNDLQSLKVSVDDQKVFYQNMSKDSRALVDLFETSDEFVKLRKLVVVAELIDKKEQPDNKNMRHYSPIHYINRLRGDTILAALQCNVSPDEIFK